MGHVPFPSVSQKEKESPHTNTNRESNKRKSGHRVLDQVRPAGTQEGSTGAIVFPVIRGVEAGMEWSAKKKKDVRCGIAGCDGVGWNKTAREGGWFFGTYIPAGILVVKEEMVYFSLPVFSRMGWRG